MMLDLRILEILSSKICHDLISPVGAINNGVELIEDIGASVTEDAMKLISSSAQQAAKRLRLFRIAYGKAGGDGVTLRDVRSTARDYVSQGKSTLQWNEEQTFPQLADKKGGLKVLLNGIMMADDVLSHGGTIVIESIGGLEGQGASITASGSHALLSDAVRNALLGETSVEDVTPRTVHAYVTRCFAEHFSLKISAHQVADDKLSILVQG